MAPRLLQIGEENPCGGEQLPNKVPRVDTASRASGPGLKLPIAVRPASDGSLTQRDGSQTNRSRESPRRADLLHQYKDQASEVIPGQLYVGGLGAAKNRELLLRLGIDHVIDFCGLGDAAAAPGNFSSFPLRDAPSEDIMSCIYDVLDIVSATTRDGGRVLLHCEKGASRSCIFAIACLMHLQGLNYASALAAVTTARPICDPNVGFQCQLLEWQNRRLVWQSQEQEGISRAALWRVVACKPDLRDRRRLAGRLCIAGDNSRTVLAPTRALLDSRLACVIVPDHLTLPMVLWIGSQAHARTVEVTRRLVPQLRQYEGIGSGRSCEVFVDGHEPAWFQQSLKLWASAEPRAVPAAMADDLPDAALLAAMEELPPADGAWLPRRQAAAATEGRARAVVPMAWSSPRDEEYEVFSI